MPATTVRRILSATLKRDALFNDVYTYSNIAFSVTTFIFGILTDKLG